MLLVVPPKQYCRLQTTHMVCLQAPEHDGHEPHAHSPQADAPAQDTSTGSHAEEHCSTASAFDAAVHVSAVISKQPEQLGDKQQGWAQEQQGFAAANRPRAAGAGREFDMLAKRSAGHTGLTLTSAHRGDGSQCLHNCSYAAG